MPDASINILVGGEAGQGLATIGQLMARALVRSGYEIGVTQDYMSRIRGGHNTFAIRTGPEPVYGPAETVDVLVALNAETVRLHGPSLSERGVVVADEGVDTGSHPAIKVPFKTLAPKPIYRNVAALGVLASTICGDIAVLEGLLRDTFGKKGEDVVEENLSVLRAAYEWLKQSGASVECMPPPMEAPSARMMINGNEAIALGALAAGCDFCSFYPMTPSTSIALALIAKGRAVGLVAEQAEDEIAAINMALGASYAGARPIVTTSGGGFALMVEGVSLAGITETPVVVALVQRPGPATGLPTRTEQGDLWLTVHAGHGEFPRAVFAPGTVEECFTLTHRAFDLAEKYQSPMFVLSDQYLADCYRAVEPFDLSALPEPASPLLEAGADYRRYEYSDSGVSPRVVPGFSPALVRVDSDEHTPEGLITEDAEVRIRQNEKRLAKGCSLWEETVPPSYEGPDAPELLLVCWGSTYAAAAEAADMLAEQGKSAGILHFSQVFPLKEDQFLPLLQASGKVVFVEGNATGQFAGLVRRETGFRAENLILRHDGRPFTAKYILSALDNIQ